jgi:hypothetical protein
VAVEKGPAVNKAKSTKTIDFPLANFSPKTTKMRAAGVTFLSITLTAAVIGNAFYQKKQFYPSVVYITKSNPCMAVSFESNSHIRMVIIYLI